MGNAMEGPKCQCHSRCRVFPVRVPSLDYLFFGGRYFFSIEATIT